MSGYVCITGDVHHRSLNTREAKYIEPHSEIELAAGYLEIAAKYGLKVTLFVTGKTLQEEWEGVESLLGYEDMELGAHTYNAFKPLALHRASKLLQGSFWLSKSQQQRDVSRTVGVFNERVGRVTAWRTHSYEYDADTVAILEAAGFTVWSDVMDAGRHYPYMVGSTILSLPINVREDHSGLYHGYMTPEYCLRESKSMSTRIKSWVRGGGADAAMPPRQLLAPDLWLDGFKQDVTAASASGVAVMNLHPVCMYLLDEFATFEKICQFLSAYKSMCASESWQLLNE